MVKKHIKSHSSDSELIDALGGPAELARRLKFAPASGTQRVHNWRTRGIPLAVRLSRPDLFGPIQEDR